jgi:imidazolonepropionase-like amidohydrolase
MTSEKVLRSANVLIRNGRIISLTANSAEVRSAALRLNAAGKYLLPGLTDGHVHLPTSQPLLEAVSDLLIANGVTQVLDLAGSSAQLRFRRTYDRGGHVDPGYMSAVLRWGIRMAAKRSPLLSISSSQWLRRSEKGTI